MKRSAIKRKPRAKDETERIYGTDAHQRWLRDKPCLICSGSPVELAHTSNGGMGRKGDAETQIPLCSTHHRTLHNTGVRTFEEGFKDRLCGRTLRSWAETYAKAWKQQGVK